MAIDVIVDNAGGRLAGDAGFIGFRQLSGADFEHEAVVMAWRKNNSIYANQIIPSR